MQFKSINVDGLNIFYREAGNEAAPKARPPARVSGFIAPRRKRGRLIGLRIRLAPIDASGSMRAMPISAWL